MLIISSRIDDFGLLERFLLADRNAIEAVIGRQGRMRSMASMETEQEVKLSRGEVQGSDNAAFSHYTLLLLIFATEFTGVVTPLIIRKSLQSC